MLLLTRMIGDGASPRRRAITLAIAYPGLPNPWVVAVSHCDGQVLNWSEGRYRHHREDKWIPIPSHPGPGGAPGWWYNSIPTRDGHVEIELPPGCYTVIASMHTWWLHGLLYGNWYTEHAIVQACCGKDTCATLYAPTAIRCLYPLFEFVFPLLVKNRVIEADRGEQLARTMRELFKPEAASRFERSEFETLRLAFEQMGKPIPGVRESE